MFNKKCKAGTLIPTSMTDSYSRLPTILQKSGQPSVVPVFLLPCLERRAKRELATV
jgi:hypothetical protein